MKLKIENFNIFEGEHELEFRPGINLIIGPNASGKSSVFYATEYILTNPSGVDDCINNDNKEAKVTLENNGNSVTWKRSAGSSTYIDNKTGKEYIKASKLDSRDVAPLGFYFDNKNRILNIHNEWSVIFPFGESDTDMFRLFEDMFNISSSFQVVDEMKKDEQLVKIDLNNYKAEKEKQIHNKEMMEGITSQIHEEDIEFFIKSINSLSSKASELEEDYNCYSMKKQYVYLELPPVFDASSLFEKFYKYNELDDISKKYVEYNKIAELSIPQVNYNIDFKEPKEMGEDFKVYQLNKIDLSKYEQQLEQLEVDKKRLLDEKAKIKICPTCGQTLGG